MNNVDSSPPPVSLRPSILTSRSGSCACLPFSCGTRTTRRLLLALLRKSLHVDDLNFIVRVLHFLFLLLRFLRFLRLFSGCKAPGQNRNVTIIRACARAREGVKNNRHGIITKIPPGEIICMQIYLISGKSGETKISYNIIFRPQPARTRAYKSNVWHLTWAFVN